MRASGPSSVHDSSHLPVQTFQRPVYLQFDFPSASPIVHAARVAPTVAFAPLTFNSARPSSAASERRARPTPPLPTKTCHDLCATVVAPALFSTALTPICAFSKHLNRLPPCLPSKVRAARPRRYHRQHDVHPVRAPRWRRWQEQEAVDGGIEAATPDGVERTLEGGFGSQKNTRIGGGQ